MPMRQIEDILSEAPLVPPSPRLRERMEEAFQGADMPAPRWFRWPVPLWACVLVAIAFGALGFLGRAAFTPPPPQVVYILPAEGELRRMLLGESERRPKDEWQNWRVTVKTVPKNEL
jgi:hypothetical protein